MEIKKEDFLEFLTDVFQSFLSDHKLNSFPGNLPISLQRNHLMQLPFGFVFANKTDGERSFLFICQHSIFTINRNLDIDFLGKTKTNNIYLFDVEIVSHLNLILIFDTLVFESKNVLRTDITQRNELARLFISTYGEIKKEDGFFTQIRFPSSYPHAQLKIDNWVIETKPLFQYHHLLDVYNSQSRLPYDCDGLVFSRLWAAYKPFTQDLMSLIKWKPITTLDFLILEAPSFPVSFISIPKEFSEFQIQKGNYILCINPNEIFSFVENDQFDENTIVECKWDKNFLNWIPIKIRKDKKTANKLTTILKSLINIKDPISIEDFIVCSNV